jgi:UDP-N-acetylmuramate: L-alanyl-gamma-D-glutamyl-meso-diaminopimelate ligase
MHIHILGIGGTFMAGVAQLARAAGHHVTGCDSGVYPPMSTQLEAAEIEVVEGYDAAQTAFEPDCYVVGNAISRGNALLEEVLEQGLPYLSGPQWLAENVLQGRWVLAVAGTHGKTTTSAMLAWILEDAGLSPGFLVGGVPVNFGVSARLSGDTLDSPFFVIEADEYDTAFCDKRSKFVHYRPRTAILNNLEFDHADIFPDLAAIETQFHHLVRTLPRNALIVSNAAEANLERVLARGCWTPVERFNDPRCWRADGSDVEGSLHLLDDDQLIGSTHWDLSGAHNRSNAVAALLAARHAGVPLARGLAALSAFGMSSGAWNSAERPRRHRIRRFCPPSDGDRDDSRRLARKVGRSRILAVLEPRSNTMKLGVMKDLLPAALPTPTRFSVTRRISAGMPPKCLPRWREKAIVEAELEQLVVRIAGSARPGDQVLVMSNGGFWGHSREAAGRARGLSDQRRR